MCLIVFLEKAIIKSSACVAEKNLYASFNPDESRKERKKTFRPLKKTQRAG